MNKQATTTAILCGLGVLGCLIALRVFWFGDRESPNQSTPVAMMSDSDSTDALSDHTTLPSIPARDTAQGAQSGAPESMRPEATRTSAKARALAERTMKHHAQGTRSVGDSPRSVIDAAPSLSGTVVCAEDGSAVPAARIVIVAWDDGRAPRQRFTASDAQGAFAFQSLSSRHVNLSVRHRDYMPKELRDVAIGGDAIEVQLSLGGVIEGNVVDTDGSPASRAYLRVQTPAGKVVKRAHADDEGAFRVSALRPGPYEVVVVSRNVSHSEESGDDPDAHDTILAKTRVDVELGSVDSITLDLQK